MKEPATHNPQSTPWGIPARKGLLLGPLLVVAVYLAFPSLAPGLGASPRMVCAVGVLMATWWLTEAVPLAATALLPLLLFPILGVMGIGSIAAQYGDPLIFLFLGGFLLGIAFEKSGLHRRIALLIVQVFGTRPSALVAGVMLATAFLSMWVSNTASALMMLPIAMGLVAMSEQRALTGADPAADPAGTPPSPGPFACCMLLGVAYAASIGGIATPIGTPPNAFAVSYLSRHHGHELDFARWMTAAMPLVLILLPLVWLLLTRVLHPLRGVPALADRSFVRAKLKELGPLSGAEWTTVAVFLAAVAWWTGRETFCRLLGLGDLRPDGTWVPRLSDAGVAIAAAVLLFALPTAGRRDRFVLRAADFARVPWEVLVLFGGGLSLAAAMDTSGLTHAIGSIFTFFKGVHPVVLIFVVALVITALSELASNTAVAATVIPVLASAADGMGVAPLLLIFPAVLSASFGFMLPVATPPNAIVYATGRLRTAHMIRAGIVVNILAIVLLTMLYGLAGGVLLRR